MREVVEVLWAAVQKGVQDAARRRTERSRRPRHARSTFVAPQSDGEMHRFAY